MLFLDGHPGLGKTLLASLLAEIFHNRDVPEEDQKDANKLIKEGRFVQFDCGQMKDGTALNLFFGAEQGLKGDHGKLYNALKDHPNAVILMDEFDKVSKQAGVADALLAATDTNGHITSQRGGDPISTSEATFIFTANFGVKNSLGQTQPGNFDAMRVEFGDPFASRIGEHGYHRFKELDDSDLIQGGLLGRQN